MKGPFKMKGFSGYVNQPIAEDKKPVTGDTDIDLSDKAAVDEYNKNIQKINKDLRSSYYRQKKAYSDSTASYETRIKAYDLLKGKKFKSFEAAEQALDEFNRLKQENKERGIYFDFRTRHMKPPGQSTTWFHQALNDDSLAKLGPEHGSRIYGLYDDLTKEHIAEKLKPKKKPVRPKYKKEVEHVPKPLETIKLETQTIKQIPTEPVKWELATPKPLKPKLKSLSKGKNKKKPWWKKIKIKLPTIKKRVGRRIKTKNLVTGGFNITKRPPRRGY